MTEKISFFYRTYAGENTATRPSWYSKAVCLKSFMASFCHLQKNLPPHQTASLQVLHDGPMKDNKEWAQTIEQQAGKHGEIIELKQQGRNEASLNAIHGATALPDKEIIIFAEDDYLWLTTALIELVRAISTLPCDYATMYDHPLTYLGLDFPHWYTARHVTEYRHWTAFESACMTFATTSGILKKDLDVFEKYHATGETYPDDRGFFREVQGLGHYKDERHLATRRLLLGSIPALATHAHMPHLALMRNWDKVARKYQSK
jgi:hypothetical protein